MNLKQLETFIWVATLGSFRKAAARLNTTQPAVSSRIASLEESLGVKLFERQNRSIALTAMGQNIFPYAEKVLFMSDKLKEQAASPETLSGVLRLGVSETLVHTWLSDFLNRVHQLFPLVDIEITVDVTSNLRKELIDRSMDLAFLLGPISDYNIENIDLCAYPLVWAASPELKLPQGRIEMDLIAQKSIITYARNTRPYAEVRAFLREGVGEPARIFPSSSLAACKRMAIDGVGVGMLPMAYIRNEVKDGQLVVIESTWQASDLVFTASYPRAPQNLLTNRIAVLASVAAEEYGQGDR
jgi:DNA-binding transcriptional LysR family regulator